MMSLLQYLFAGAVASLLPLLLLRLFHHHRYRTKSEAPSQADVAAEKEAGECERGDRLSRGGGGFDVIVVGAGVAGSALAYTLGKDGRRVQVIERNLTEPDRIVGELLQPGGYLKLLDLGLEDCVEEIDAQRVLGYALFKDGRDTKVAYPLEKFNSDVAGRSFHNGRFIQKLRGKAASLPKSELPFILPGCLFASVSHANSKKKRVYVYT